MDSFFNPTDLLSTIPEITLLVTALILLLLEVFSSPPRSWFAPAAIIGGLIAIVLDLIYTQQGQFYSGMISVNRFTLYFDFIFILSAEAAILIAVPYLRRTLEERGEYYSLMLFATIGMMLMAKAHDLTITFLGLELLSLSLYVLVGFYRHRLHSNESGLKYLLLGAFSTGFFLFGIALIYGSTGSTHYDSIRLSILEDTQISEVLTLAGFGLLIVGFAFKTALVPFHMYAPDVYQGAPTSITAFISTGPKMAGFAAFLKIIVVAFAITTRHWWGVIWLMAVLTMTVGNVTAIAQSNIKRMLAFSSIAHAGYLSIAILVGTEDAAFGMMFYLLVYAVMNLGAFGILALFERDDETGLDIEEYRGRARRNPVLAGALSLALFSLAGFPPTAGFLGKYFVFNAAVDEGYIWLVVIAVLNSLVSVYYYLRPVVYMYMSESGAEQEPVVLPRIFLPVIALLVLVSLGLGIFPMFLVKNSFIAALSLF